MGRSLTATPQCTLQRQLRHESGVSPTHAPALLLLDLRRHESPSGLPARGHCVSTAIQSEHELH